MRSGFLRILWLVTLLLPFVAQGAGHKFLDANQKENVLIVETRKGHFLFSFYRSDILETRFVPAGTVAETQSYSVAMARQETGVSLSETQNQVQFSSDDIVVEIRKKPFSITLRYRDKPMIACTGAFAGKQGAYNGFDFDLLLPDDEIFYGGGTRVLGMNRRGYRLELYNRAHYGYTTYSELMNYSIPMVISSGGYALYFDSPSKGWLDLDSSGDGTLKFETAGPGLVFYFMVAPDVTSLPKVVTSLLGRQPMPPRWAFGNFASRFGYHSEKQVRDVVERFRKDSIPLDAVVLDIYWFGPEIRGSMGNFTFYRDSFPEPEKMIRDFRNAGIKTVLVTEPFILTTSERWDEAVAANVLGHDSLGLPYTYEFYFGHTGLVDIFEQDARSWFWNLYKPLEEMGVEGWWGDLGEPEVHPSGLMHTAGSADELHNAYGHEWARMIWENSLNDRPDKRPFILMRSGAAGSQRYGLIPWTGDVDRSWGGLKPQVELSLQMGMQGIAYMHSDLGGFAGGETFDPELYLRWLQYGVFQPLFRPHAQEHIPPEPVFHSNEVKQAAREIIRLRYALIPYIYTLAFENMQSGMPLMRPLFFEEPENKDFLTDAKRYLWGPDIYVTPITDPGVTELDIPFPGTDEWIGFFNPDIRQGGTIATVRVEKEHIPVYVRSGAIIPMVEPALTTEDYSTEKLTLNLYLGTKSCSGDGMMYDDDGKTPDAYSKGMYELIRWETEHRENLTKVKIYSEAGDRYHCTDREITLAVHAPDQKVRSVVVDGREIIPESGIDGLQSVKFPFSAARKKAELEIYWQ
ncbi:MAG: hypothetical protein Kow00127_20090 [Bacteroidales bacterium]